MSGGLVLVRRRALGDVVLLGAVTAALDAPATVVTDPRYVELARRLVGVGHAVPWGSARPEGRVVDLQRSMQTLWAFPFAARVRKHSVARRLRVRGWGRGRPPVTALYGRAVGVVPREPPWFVLPEIERHTLALIPGASTPLKAASAETLVEVGRRWSGRTLVLGGPGEADLVAHVTSRISGAEALVEHGFARTLLRLASVGVAVGGDSGLLHLARACGASVVALAGPTHPDDGFLVGSRLSVVQRSLSCRPCTLHRATTCRVGGRPCMELAVRAIWAAVCEAWCALGHPH